MLEAVEGNIHQRLCALLDEHQARYRVMAHDAVGQCEAVSAILAADQQADLASLARHIGGSKASLASPAEVDALTACVFGAIPPFSFHPALRLVADPLLFERFPQIAFNAGRLDRSIILDTEDYLHIARPEIATFRRLS